MQSSLFRDVDYSHLNEINQHIELNVDISTAFDYEDSKKALYKNDDL